jgi:sugar lactone lactonase YvrE
VRILSVIVYSSIIAAFCGVVFLFATSATTIQAEGILSREALLQPMSVGVSFPEAIAIGPAQELWIGSDDGQLYRADRTRSSEPAAVFAELGGLSIGLAYDSVRRCLWSATYGVGIQRIDLDGDVAIGVTLVVAEPFPEDVLVLPDGDLLYTVASESLTPATVAPDAPIVEWNLIDPKPSGSLWRLQPESSQRHRITSGLAFPSGIAAVPDSNEVLVVEIAAARVLRIPLDGGSPTQFGRDLPGVPDDIVRDADGRWWVTLPAPRPRLLGLLRSSPELAVMYRKLPYVAQRRLMTPRNGAGGVTVLGDAGNLLAVLQFKNTPVSQVANAVFTGSGLIFGALAGDRLLSLEPIPSLEPQAGK